MSYRGYSLDYMDPAHFALYPNTCAKTKEERAAEFDRIYGTHFIAQAAPSVRTKVDSMPKTAAPTKAVPISSTSVSTELASVPKHAAPTKAVPISSIGPIPVPKEAATLLVQTSSVGPVPPVTAADSPGAAEFPAPENGDQILLYLSPLTTVTLLEYHWLATILQSPPVPEHQEFSSTCHLPSAADTKPPMELITLVPPSPAAPPPAAIIAPGRPPQAPSCCGYRPRRQGRPAVHPSNLHFPLFEQEGQTS